MVSPGSKWLVSTVLPQTPSATPTFTVSRLAASTSGTPGAIDTNVSPVATQDAGNPLRYWVATPIPIAYGPGDLVVLTRTATASIGGSPVTAVVDIAHATIEIPGDFLAAAVTSSSFTAPAGWTIGVNARVYVAAATTGMGQSAVVTAVSGEIYTVAWAATPTGNVFLQVVPQGPAINASGQVSVQYGTGAGQINLATGNLAGPVVLPTTPPAGYGGSGGGGFTLSGQAPANFLDGIMVEPGINIRQAMAPILAAAAGVVAGAGSGTIIIKGANSATTRVVAQTDNAGNRNSVTLVLPN